MIKIYELQEVNEVEFIQGDCFFKPKFNYDHITNSIVPNADDNKLRTGERLTNNLYKVEICRLGLTIYNKLNGKDDRRLHIE
jgi:hypothetical protein